ncbi:amino acid ABC transporter substrate-binding protein [Variovorax paradoxus]|jgi:iron(III) transport system ATP-binding protein|uniref:putative 2-aminoethylphosphonate ABC transporter ATP-binding protein n=1 Tax=Variovorax paradoxus TaxID=34073 RepID=UPI0006E72BE9|nr:amino acid ABC transporter substrate-binding protein [Variovorax paradoxus]KPV08528.1 amino acid ABC transporter substrate-binding protein [Variovorax paradoxus]KPV13640.1 amino acid ABC transporter substrate-binding protein [Variovorax paradoxus]KPV23429.1 amino acid ABC transporter substrate-binding protein [Variovorax paradoxus]KPV36482.1 amino acid ABC transporter substrate-binding protein [Variovorax paradoxus]
MDTTDTPFMAGRRPASGAAALEVIGVRKDFETFSALRDVHLRVNPGEMLCFLGPSGCGKTTLLRIIAGLETQTAGQILQNGKDVSWLPPDRRDYGIVFQSYALFPNLTIAENIGYGLVNGRARRAEVKARVDELLKLVGLPTSGAKYPSQLSGGQQQRVALARALATRPGLLLLDEPLSALDALERIRLRGEIRRLQKQVGITTIMVTHDQEEALSMADRIVVMNHGVIEQVGTPMEVYEQPATPFVADFVGKVNVLRSVALGNHRFQVGDMELQCDACDGAFEPGEAVNLYLRPEDRAVEHLREDTANRLRAMVTKVEFLGGLCIAEVTADALHGQTLGLHFSLNQLHDLGIREGHTVDIALRANRIRAFSAARAQQP